MELRGFRLPRWPLTALEIVCVAAAYWLVSHPGLAAQLGATGHLRALWPASGIGLGALLLLGLKTLPGVALGAFVHAVTTEQPALLVAGITLAATVGALLAYLPLRRVSFRIEMDRVKDALAFVVCGPVAAMLLAALIYATSSTLAQEDASHDYFLVLLVTTWLSWGLGVLVVTPVLLVLRGFSWPWRVGPTQLLEAFALVAATGAVTYLALTVSDHLLFLAFPLVIWAAWRYQLAGSAPCVLLIAAVVVSTTMEGPGPFQGADPRSTLITIQAFIGSAALVSLFLAVGVTERNNARTEILQTANQLVGAVKDIEDHLRPRSPGPAERTDPVQPRVTPRADRPTPVGSRPGMSPVPFGGPSDPTEAMEHALGARNLIERAIGIVMQQHRCNADIAFEVLRRNSLATRRNLRDVADEFIARATDPAEPIDPLGYDDPD